MDNSTPQFTVNHGPVPPYPALPVLGGLLGPRAALTPAEVLHQQHAEAKEASDPSKKVCYMKQQAQPALSPAGISLSTGGLQARKPYTITKQREKWSEEEHERFLEALRKYGRAWRKIEGTQLPDVGPFSQSPARWVLT
jgi:hypothetical protein